MSNGYIILDVTGFDGSTSITIDGISSAAIESIGVNKPVIVAGIAGVTPSSAELSIEGDVVTVKTISKVFTITNDVIAVVANTSTKAIK